jgi:hypothetical protein
MTTQNTPLLINLRNWKILFEAKLALAIAEGKDAKTVKALEKKVMGFDLLIKMTEKGFDSDAN